MKLVTFDTFFPEVMPSVFGCPELVAYNAVRNTVIDFCTDTWFWQHTCAPQPGQPLLAEYTPDLPYNTKLLGVVDAWYDGRNLHQHDENFLRYVYWHQNPFDVQGDPVFIYTTDTNTIKLLPIPQVASQFAGLEMLVSVAPLRTSMNCWDQLYERYAEVIAQGTLARLKNQTKQPWTDVQGAAIADAMYRKGRAEAKMWVQRNKTRGSMAIRYQGSSY